MNANQDIAQRGNDICIDYADTQTGQRLLQAGDLAWSQYGDTKIAYGYERKQVNVKPDSDQSALHPDVTLV